MTQHEGHLASEILEDPFINHILSTIEQGLHEQWEMTKDTNLREEVWFTLQGAKRFRNMLETAVQNAEFDNAMEAKYDNSN